MKIKLIVLIGNILLCSILYAQQNIIKPVQEGEAVPNIPLTLRAGNSINETYLSDYKGKLIILDF